MDKNLIKPVGWTALASAALTTVLVASPFHASPAAPESSGTAVTAVSGGSGGYVHANSAVTHSRGTVLQADDPITDPAQNRIRWNLSQGRTGYISMIDNLREQAASRDVYNDVEVTEDSTRYLGIDVVTPNLERTRGSQAIRLIVRPHDLYIQGYYVPATHTYYHFEGALLTRHPEAHTNLQLPFGGSYADMTAYADQHMDSPVFRMRDLVNNTHYLAEPSSTGAQRAGALLSFVEVVAEAARFNPIFESIRDHLNQETGYRLTAEDIGLIRNWQSLGNRFQALLDNPHTPPYPTIGRYHFSTPSNYAAVLALVLSYTVRH